MKAKSKLVKDVPALSPFWIARYGDWLYLFDHPDGRMLGKLFCPTEPTP